MEAETMTHDELISSLKTLLAKMLPKFPPDECAAVARAIARLEILEASHKAMTESLKAMHRRLQQLEDDGA
jgi:hypothetical protein